MAKQCPKCGAPMEKRTARKGRYRGQEFYGCSRYPACKGIVNMDKPSGSREMVETFESELEFPHILRARAVSEGFQVKFFDAIAVDKSSVGERFNSREVCSQWRLDYPERQDAVSLDEKQIQVLSVAEKILTRGRVTLMSPLVEDRLRTLDEADVVMATEVPWLDSEEEKMFYRDVLGKGLGRWVLPQVELASLFQVSSSEVVSGRGDFVISHPSLEKSIVVEIDGEQHKGHVSADSSRDASLINQGYEVFRVPASEVREKKGSSFDDLVAYLSKVKLTDSMYGVGTLGKRVHQLELSILEAIRVGYLSMENPGSWVVGIVDDDLVEQLLKVALEDLVELLVKLAELYDLEMEIGEPSVVRKQSDVNVSIRFGSWKGVPDVFCIQDIYVPFSIVHETMPAKPAVLKESSVETLEFFLRYLFRKDSFLEGQYDAVSRALLGKDSILLLPTGGGKSIAFQLAALLLPGRAVVIDPIISLIDDQIDNLASYGIDRCIGITSAIRSASDRSRAMLLFGQGEYLFAYVAPERFQTKEFRESLKSLTTHTPVSLVAVDEAHCVSEWGHDFRTAYLNIGRISRKYCSSHRRVPPLMALTGTASRAVLKDLQRELGILNFEAIITPKSFDRPELQFHVVQADSKEKERTLEGYLGKVLPSYFSQTSASFYQLKENKTMSGLVFCPHVGGDYGVNHVAEQIGKHLGIATVIYSGSKPNNYKGDWDSVKQRNARLFKYNEIPLLVGTKAFGMGIDKPNIRYTIHYGLPGSIEAFYQEAGRAGRDRSPAHCLLIVSNEHPRIAERLLDPSTEADEIVRTIEKQTVDARDDISRALWFHTKAFKGIEAEKKLVLQVLKRLGDVQERGTRRLVFKDIERGDVEKSLHRLLLLGIVDDYTIDYSKQEFTVILTGNDEDEVIAAYGDYVASYLESRRFVEEQKAMEFLEEPFEDFVEGMTELLLSFIYDVIERGRRRALHEMLLAVTVDPSDEGIRKRILNYLEQTEHSEFLEHILQAEDSGLKSGIEVISRVRSPNEAAEIRGQIARYLESYPDHPVFLMIRALAELLCRDSDSVAVEQNFIASVQSARDRYGFQKDSFNHLVVWGLEVISQHDHKLTRKLFKKVWKEHQNRDLSRRLINALDGEIVDEAASYLLHRLETRIGDLVQIQGGY